MILLWAVLVTLPATNVLGRDLRNARHLTALVGQDVVLDCPLNFPDGVSIPYVIEWKKQKLPSPLYIWYDGYPPHVADSYGGRVSRVDVRNTKHGMASLNMTNITEADSGWYECIVHFLNRSPAAMGNGTWVHLDVHAPPRFISTPDKEVFVNVGDSVILACEARGTPEPVVTWYKEDKLVQQSETIAVRNDGTELRITKIGEDDIGDYICHAENREGDVHWTTKIIMAGGAVIVQGPTNQTRMESTQAVLTCSARSRPANYTIRWLRDDIPVERHSGLEKRFRITSNGSLVIDPVAADDAGMFTCQVSNGIGTPQRASAFLEVQYAAHVPYTPSVQHLPMGMQGIIRCHIKANPPIQFVNWLRNQRPFDPKLIPGVSVLANGSILIDKVTREHQGTYRCEPYNLHGNSGVSGEMQVVVRDPPTFVVRPKNLYQRKVHDSIEMPCVVAGNPPAQVMWRRHDNQSLPSDRATINEGNITIKSLQKSDFGYYECMARNSVSTIVTSTQLVVEGTTPHAPHNLTANASRTSITLRWLPGYSGGDDFDQKYTVWYQQQSGGSWNTYEVQPAGATQVTIHHLLPDTFYQLMVAAKNSIGEGRYSDKLVVKTLSAVSATAGPEADSAASIKEALGGPTPGKPQELNMTEAQGGFLMTWRPPEDAAEASDLYYSIKYKPAEGQWKRLGDEKLTRTSYLVKQLQGGRTYYFRVFAHWDGGVTQSSDELKFTVPDHIQKKAITAALVGGLLLLIVSIILSVCTVKICNKHKRRKQEKEYNMVACRVSDAHNGLQSPVPLKKSLEKDTPAEYRV